LYSIAEKRLLRTVFLGEKTEGLACSPSLIVHPNGRWLAVVKNLYPETGIGRDLDPRDLPQPRILLIEPATGEIRETMIAPHGIANAACFSPNGRTLATGGHGRVLLWDMTKMPGE
ncbi:MAG TPA: WD40 repeat domain-containing protein, partial [Nitrospira sp.]|nr:WD40 repeat domain-containing protein [Nitrospira sp.]